MLFTVQILRTLDENQDHAVSFVSVLHSLVSSVIAYNKVSCVDEKHHNLSQSDSLKSCTISKRLPSATEIQRYFDEYRQQKAAASNIYEDDVDKTSEIDALNSNAENKETYEEFTPDNVENEKKNIPDHIKLVIEVRCVFRDRRKVFSFALVLSCYEYTYKLP